MIDNIIVVLYLIITLVLGLKISSTVKSDQDYINGGKNYSALTIFATLSACFIGGGFTIGLAEKTFKYGIVFIIAIWGFSLKEILIAKFIAPKMKKFQANASTVGDIMEINYGKNAKILSGIASLLCCGGIIGAQVAACGNIVYILTGISPMIGSLCAAGAVVIYATAGGLKSVIVIDVMHFCILIIMIPIIMWFGLNNIGGINHLFSSLPASYLSPTGSIGGGALTILMASFFLGETLIPPYVQRLLIGKSAQETQQGTFLSGIMSIFLFLIIGIIGMIAFVIDPSIEAKFALPYVIITTMPVGIKGLAIAAMLAVIMSSADSFLNATGIAIKEDLLKPLGLANIFGLSNLNVSKLSTLAIGMVAIIFALTTSSVIDILLYSYQFWTPFILVPLIATIYNIKSSPQTFFGSAITGVLTVVIWNIANPFSIGIDGALEGVIVGVLVNGITFISLTKILSIKNTKISL